ncbi:N(6)-adenine-specific methyltransferase METTL4 [Sabethes cyaneus]|uniref:N(6)-adenine-specific methyltransferase METTL4 n=1 Tax=Sabethes cyaneus TaxID=53552 RepID=UPI00237EAA3C|nr:N(6)-adenine-specific methyltransferase METTL4 [Sabethes cyaneus]
MACKSPTSNDNIVILDHKSIVDIIYSSKFFDPGIEKALMKTDLFCIDVPYDRKERNSDETTGEPKSKKRKKTDQFNETTLKVQRNYTEFYQLEKRRKPDTVLKNTKALELVDSFTANDNYSSDTVFKGSNNSPFTVICEFFNESFIIPPKCRFFNSNVSDMCNLLNPDDEKFDFIVMDPPWWNKYIRRTKAANRKVGYQMMDNESIKSIPLEDYIHDDTIVVIWCTNSPTHETAIKETFLCKWKLKLLTTWFWVKVTNNGETICEFKESTKKQPFEKILIATSARNSRWNFSSEKFIYSVPCALHSNKPPLLDLFTDLLPKQPKCLELFARNVYPNFTSIGIEVLKLQNARLFEIIKVPR